MGISAKPRRSPVGSQVKAYEETWKAKHDEAMECWEWEEHVLIGIQVWKMLDESIRRWRERVSRGIEPYEETDNTCSVEGITIFLEAVDIALTEAANFERKKYEVNGIQDLRTAKAEAQAMLDSWQPPRLAAFALRDMTVSEEAINELHELAKKASTLPSLPTPRAEKVDASFLKGKAC